MYMLGARSVNEPSTAPVLVRPLAWPEWEGSFKSEECLEFFRSDGLSVCLQEPEGSGESLSIGGSGLWCLLGDCPFLIT